METFITVLCVFLIVFAVALIVLVLLQAGKDAGMSGAIAGNSDSFFGKAKSKQKDAILSNITTILSVVFVLIVLAVYILQ